MIKSKNRELWHRSIVMSQHEISHNKKIQDAVRIICLQKYYCV